jgi:hypothetical protein
MGPARISVLRIPIDVAVRGVVRARKLSLGVEAGPLLSWVRVEGRDLPAAAGAGRLQGGVRAALVARVDVGPVCPYATAWGEWSAPAEHVAVVPDGPVGQLPSFWVGVAVGVSLEMTAFGRRPGSTPPDGQAH